MFTLTVQFQTKDELLEFLSDERITSDIKPSVKVEDPAQEEAAPKKKAPKKAAPKKEEAKPAPKKEEAPAEATDALDYETHVKPKVLELSKAKDREAVLSVLADFGVDSAKELKQDQFQAFIDALQNQIDG